jgi:AcrR family transcriptional regulator
MPAKGSAAAGAKGKPASRGEGEKQAPNGRPRSKERWEERRREVLDIAAQLFAERGYHATSIQDLVDATGLKRGGLYHYINGKADLLIQIHQRVIDPLLADARRIAAEEGPADVILRALAVALINDIANYHDEVIVFLNEWRIIGDDPEWTTVREARKEFEGVIESVLQAGMDEGIFRISDRRLAVLGFLGMFNYTYQWYQPGGRVSPQHVADYFCDIYLDGVRS